VNCPDPENMINPFEYTKQANPVLSLLQVVVAVVARLACVCVCVECWT
jgi:hypothetical protein